MCSITATPGLSCAIPSHPAIGLILDSFHSLARKVPIESLPDIDPAKIFMVQLADAPLLEMDLLSWSRHFRNLPGQGDLAIVDYAAALRGAGLRWRLVARDLQRSVSRQSRIDDRGRRHAIPALPR